MKNQIVQKIIRIFVLMMPYKPSTPEPKNPELRNFEVENLHRRYIDDRAAQIIAMSGRFF